MAIFEKLFGTHSERELKYINKDVDKINSLREQTMNLTDDELKHKTTEFKERLASGASLDDLMVEAYAVVREAGRRTLGMELYDVQLAGAIVLHQGRIAEAKTGEGKAVTLDTKIPTPEGWKVAGDIKVGDELFDANGKPTKVTGVYPQGRQDIYEVTLSDSRQVKCADDHLWKVYRHTRTNETTDLNKNKGKAEVLTTLEILEEGLTNKGKYTFSLPVCKPVEYCEANLAVDPYFLGKFLHDESMVESSKEYYDSPSLELLKRLKNKKRLAPKYKTASIEQRLKFLQGLFKDSEDEESSFYKHSTTSESLKNDILEIIYSLGLYGTFTFDNVTEKYNVYLKLPEELRKVFFSLHNLKDINISDKNYNQISILKIRKTNKRDEQVCFSVDNEDRLFLVGDYVVTHNTFMCVPACYLNALEGKGAHLVTVNDYLAKRDSEQMRKVYEFLGLSVGCIEQGMTPDERKEAYRCDITYTTNSELGFDYLRDNMALSKDDLVQRELNYCIIDEVDSILIDEARTPLIISGQSGKSTKIYEACDLLASQMKQGKYRGELNKLDIILKENLEEDGEFIVNEKDKIITLTEDGVKRVEEFFHIDNLADMEHMDIQHGIDVALKAHYLFFRDQNYIVTDSGEIQIVDEFTGRVMPGRRFSDGIHQAIEAKEHVPIKQESKTLATITYQNFFNKYNKKSGMTGTAQTEEKEFRDIYGLDVIVIPTNEKIKRVDHEDAVFKTKKEKYDAIIKEVKKSYKIGQPVLVGTITIEISELLSDMLRKEGIPHNVLNAKYHEQEAEIVKMAGQKGAVTIATNMAGRGTDIKLGEGVEELGGLKIIGTERHESRRIDNQLRGRSGRQGDFGESKFFISLEDDLMRLFGSERMISMFNTLGIPEGAEIQHKMLSNAIETAQKRIENNHYGMRKRVLEYDITNNEQREIIYKERRRVLDGDNLKNSILSMIKNTVNDIVCSEVNENEEINKQELIIRLNSEVALSDLDLSNLESKEELIEYITNKALEYYNNKEAELNNSEIIRQVERAVLLRVVDRNWQEHIDNLEQLRIGIGLQAYAQRDPVVEYKIQAYQMFNELMDNISRETVKILMHLSYVPQVIEPGSLDQDAIEQLKYLCT